MDIYTLYRWILVAHAINASWLHDNHGQVDQWLSNADFLYHADVENAYRVCCLARDSDILALYCDLIAPLCIECLYLQPPLSCHFALQAYTAITKPRLAFTGLRLWDPERMAKFLGELQGDLNESVH